MNISAVITPNAFAPACRVNRALTAHIEKRALQWMAERAPRWLTSDQLTLLGLSAQIAAGVFYALARYSRFALLAVILCLVLNWLGDSMDGTLARVRRQQRPRYGFYVDRLYRAHVRTRPLGPSSLAGRHRDAPRVSASCRRKLSRHLHPVTI
jgi:archaetidylinositol phosphate synthase